MEEHLIQKDTGNDEGILESTTSNKATTFRSHLPELEDPVEPAQHRGVLLHRRLVVGVRQEQCPGSAGQRAVLPQPARRVKGGPEAGHHRVVLSTLVSRLRRTQHSTPLHSTPWM